MSPKKLSLAKAEGELAEQMTQLKVKQDELQAITDKLNGLTEDCEVKQQEKKVNISHLYIANRPIKVVLCTTMVLKEILNEHNSPAHIKHYNNQFLQDLENNIQMTKVKIVRAEKLISGLGGEKERWTLVRVIRQ